MSIKEFRNLLHSTYKSYDTEENIDIYFTRPIGLFFALIWKRLGVHPNATQQTDSWLALQARRHLRAECLTALLLTSGTSVPMWL